MKTETQKFLKEAGKSDLFTEERFQMVKRFMKYQAETNPPLKQYLMLDPLNKAQFVADHIVKLVELKLLK